MPQWPAGHHVLFPACCREKRQGHQSPCLRIVIVIIIDVRTNRTARDEWSHSRVPLLKSPQPATSLSDNNGSLFQRRGEYKQQTTVDWCSTSKGGDNKDVGSGTHLCCWPYWEFTPWAQLCVSRACTHSQCSTIGATPGNATCWWFSPCWCKNQQSDVQGWGGGGGGCLVEGKKIKIWKYHICQVVNSVCSCQSRSHVEHRTF